MRSWWLWNTRATTKPQRYYQGFSTQQTKHDTHYSGNRKTGVAKKRKKKKKKSSPCRDFRPSGSDSGLAPARVTGLPTYILARTCHPELSSGSKLRRRRRRRLLLLLLTIMDDFASDTDSDYTSYWRDWVSAGFLLSALLLACLLELGFGRRGFLWVGQSKGVLFSAQIEIFCGDWRSWSW